MQDICRLEFGLSTMSISTWNNQVNALMQSPSWDSKPTPSDSSELVKSVASRSDHQQSGGCIYMQYMQYMHLCIFLHILAYSFCIFVHIRCISGAYKVHILCILFAYLCIFVAYLLHICCISIAYLLHIFA